MPILEALRALCRLHDDDLDRVVTYLSRVLAARRLRWTGSCNSCGGALLGADRAFAGWDTDTCRGCLYDDLVEQIGAVT